MPKKIPERSGRRGETAGSTANSHGEAHFRLVLGDEFGKNRDERNIRKGQQVRLFVAAEQAQTQVIKVGFAKLSTAGPKEEPVQRTLHLHKLPQTEEEDLVVITGVSFNAQAAKEPYPYKFKGGGGPPSRLKDIYSACFYAWDSRMMLALNKSAPRLSKVISQELKVPETPNRNISICTPLRKPDVKQRRAFAPSMPSQDEHAAVLPQALDHAGVIETTRSCATPQSLGNPSPSSHIDENEDVAEINLADRGHKVPIHRYLHGNYAKVEVRLRRSKVFQPTCILRLISQNHTEGLRDRFNQYGYDYDNGYMTITVRRSENKGLKHLTPESLIQSMEHLNDHGVKVPIPYMKNDIIATTVDGIHRCRALQLLDDLCGQESRCKWLHEPLRMILILRKDGVDISDTELLFLASQRNRLTSTVRPFETLEDYLYTVISYLKSFAQEHNLALDEVHPPNLAEEMNIASLIPKIKKGTYLRYARIAKIFAIHPAAYHRLLSFMPDIPPKIGAAHLDSAAYFAVDEQGVLLFLEGLNAYLCNTAATRTGDFPCTAFYRGMINLYERCRYCYDVYGVQRNLSFPEFLAIQLPHTMSKTISISDLFTCQMRLFSNKTKGDVEKTCTRAVRFENRIKSFFDAKKQKKSTVTSSSARKDVSSAVPTLTPAEPLRRSRREVKAPPSTFLDAYATLSRSSKKRKTLASVSRNKKASKTQFHNPVIVSPTSNSKVKHPIITSTNEDKDRDDLDDDGFLKPHLEESDQGFDDLVPSHLPFGYREHSCVYKGEDRPSWPSIFALDPESVSRHLGNSQELHQTPWLRELHICEGHRAHLFCTKDFLFFIHRLAWLIACEKQLVYLQTRYPYYSCPLLKKNSWNSALEVFCDGIGSHYFTRQELQLQHQGYCILEGFADETAVPEPVLDQLSSPIHRFAAPLQNLYKHYVTTFPGEATLRNEENRCSWNPIINVGDPATDNSNRDSGKARYSSTRMLLMDITEESPETVWAALRRAQLDVWVGQLALLLGIKNSEEEAIFVPKTGGRFLLTGENCPRQTPHVNFQILHRGEQHRSPGYFAIVSGAQPFPLWVSDYSHNFVFNPLAKLNLFGKALCLRKIIVPPMSVFFGHGYCTHAGAGYESRINDETSIRYHLYFIPEQRRAPDSVFFAFGYAPEFEAKKKKPSNTIPSVCSEDNARKKGEFHEDSITHERVVLVNDDEKFSNRSEGSNTYNSDFSYL